MNNWWSSKDCLELKTFPCLQNSPSSVSNSLDLPVWVWTKPKWKLPSLDFIIPLNFQAHFNSGARRYEVLSVWCGRRRNITSCYKAAAGGRTICSFPLKCTCQWRLPWSKQPRSNPVARAPLSLTLGDTLLDIQRGWRGDYYFVREYLQLTKTKNVHFLAVTERNVRKRAWPWRLAMLWPRSPCLMYDAASRDTRHIY